MLPMMNVLTIFSIVCLGKLEAAEYKGEMVDARQRHQEQRQIAWSPSSSEPLVKFISTKETSEPLLCFRGTSASTIFPYIRHDAFGIFTASLKTQDYISCQVRLGCCERF
jgi:hypothetical protein